jgi:hypothetical protein
MRSSATQRLGAHECQLGARKVELRDEAQQRDSHHQFGYYQRRQQKARRKMVSHFRTVYIR